MKSAFIDGYGADDMQQDTYRIVAALVYESMRSYRAKQPANLERDVSSLFLLVRMRLKKERRAEMKKKLDEVKNLLYGRASLTIPQQNDLFDKEEELLGEILEELDNAGILYRARSDLNALVAGG